MRIGLCLLALVVLTVPAQSQTTVYPELRQQDADCAGDYGSGTSFSIGEGGGWQNNRAWLFFPVNDIPEEFSVASLMLSNDPHPVSADVTVMLWDINDPTMGYELPPGLESIYWGRHEADGSNSGEGYPTSEIDLTSTLEGLRPFDQQYLVIMLSAPICSSVGGIFRGPATEHPDDLPRIYFEAAVGTTEPGLGGVKELFR